MEKIEFLSSLCFVSRFKVLSGLKYLVLVVFVEIDQVSKVQDKKKSWELRHCRDNLLFSLFPLSSFLKFSLF